MPGSRSVFLIVYVVLFCTAGAPDPVAAQVASAETGLVGSPHDLGGRAADGTVDICAFCHVPELGDVSESPSWTDGNGRKPGEFVAYGASAGREMFGKRPQGVSLVCLSCHDSMIAIDVAAIYNQTTTPDVYSGRDGNFAAGHPISIPYYRRYDPSLNKPSDGRVGSLPLYRATGAEGTRDRVECPSCHDPHAMIFGKFLRVSNANSALCRHCHNI